MATLYTTETSPIMYTPEQHSHPFVTCEPSLIFYTIDPRSVLLLLSSMHWTKTTFCITEPLRLCSVLNHARCGLRRVRPTVTEWCLLCAVRKYSHFVKHRTTKPLSSTEPRDNVPPKHWTMTTLWTAEPCSLGQHWKLDPLGKVLPTSLNLVICVYLWNAIWAK
jgi:hypothetical protein